MFDTFACKSAWNTYRLARACTTCPTLRLGGTRRRQVRSHLPPFEEPQAGCFPALAVRDTHLWPSTYGEHQLPPHPEQDDALWLHHPVAQAPPQLLAHLQQLGAGAGVVGAGVGTGAGVGVEQASPG